MQELDFFTEKIDINAENYPQALRQAIGIEIATIPVYLYTYYSINRVPDQNAIMQDLVQRLLARKEAPPTFDEATKIAQKWSARIMVFANLAGANVVSVAIEEMLHMSLSGNVYQATLGQSEGPPKFGGLAPTQWPAFLPGHQPPFPISRQGFCLDQLKTFLFIESPHKLAPVRGVVAAPPIDYVTIGEFYQSIIDFLQSNPKEITYDAALPQLVPGNGYYAQNNINTNYYNRHHQSRFVNAEDSGELIFVKDTESACKALEVIKEQGEGSSKAPGLGPNNMPVCDEPPEFDDPTDHELTHFGKFNRLWCRLSAMEEQLQELLEDDGFDVKKYFVYNVPVNPSTKDYPDKIQSMSNLLNAVYSYTFIMTESCYNVEQPVQFEIFMGGIHKTMMWILGTLCGTIVGLTYKDKHGTEWNAAPTFEEYAFNTASSPKSQIQALSAAALANYPDQLHNVNARINSLPNIPLSARPDTTNSTVFA